MANTNPAALSASTEAQVIANIAATLGGARQADNDSAPYAIIPEGYTLEDLEHTLQVPIRKRGSIITTDTASFIEYAKLHGSLADCTIYANVHHEDSRCELVAILNDHGSDETTANWRDHRCTFAPALSVEWKRWTHKDGSKMSQADFATWLEDNLADVCSVDGSPTGADILAMAQAFLAPMRRAINEMRSGEVDAVQGYAVTRLPTHGYARLDHCLAGTSAFLERLAPQIDCTPLTRIEKKLAHGIPLTMAELDACTAVLRRVEDALIRMDRRAVQSALLTTQIGIEFEALQEHAA